MSATVGARPSAYRPLPLPVRRGWWPDTVGVLTWSSILVVVGLWVHGDGLSDLVAGSSGTLRSLGRLCGLLASDLMLLQVLGMARIPWAERSFGQDRLARWHRWAGFTSFNLMVVHVVTIVVGYALADRISVLAEAWSMTTTFGGVLLAVAGFALVVLVTVTSLRAARRRLRYESWHLLHLYAYLGIGLALPHQLWTGTDFAGSPLASAYWWTLYGLALACVLVYRLGRPLWLSARHRIRVEAVVPEVSGAVSLYLVGRRLDDLPVEPGQFFVWRFRTGAGWTRGHPLSLSAAPTTRGLRLTVGTRGDDGARLAAMRPGTSVLIEGPYGRMTPRVRTRPRVAAFAAGIGIAPLVAVLHASAWSGEVDTLVLRTSGEGTALADDVRWLAEQTGLRVVPLVGHRAPTGTSWLPAHLAGIPGPEAVRRLLPDLDQHDVFVCGPAPWTDAVTADLRRAGLPSDAIHLEKFSW